VLMRLLVKEVGINRACKVLDPSFIQTSAASF